MKKYQSFLQTVLTILGVIGFFVSFFATQAAAKNVKGSQSGKWALNDSPYLVEGDIIIPPGEVLIIEPGVVVKFLGFNRIKVQGCLLAKGNSTNKIIFTSNKDFEFGTTDGTEGEKSTPQTTDWDLIEFSDDANQQSSELSHCIIRYSAGMIQCENASPALKNILIVDCNRNQVYINGLMQAIKQGQEIDIPTIRPASFTQKAPATEPQEADFLADSEELTSIQILIFTCWGQTCSTK